jgi:hypothetical protein
MNIHQDDMGGESHRTMDSLGPGGYPADDSISESGQATVEIEGDEGLIFHYENPGWRWHPETRFQTARASQPQTILADALWNQAPRRAPSASYLGHSLAWQISDALRDSVVPAQNTQGQEQFYRAGRTVSGCMR